MTFRQLTPELAEQLWYMAAGSELGVTFPVAEGDSKMVETILYNTRNALNDPELTSVSLKRSADDLSITLYKRADAELPE